MTFPGQNFPRRDIPRAFGTSTSKNWHKHAVPDRDGRLQLNCPQHGPVRFLSHAGPPQDDGKEDGKGKGKGKGKGAGKK